jgi:cysteinyl-tRNA synthetase
VRRHISSMLKIYNSLKREKQVFTPIEANKVRMYVCGMTVYDYCHLGHARVMVVFDMVYRWLKASGYDVTYVRNITDIDDKIIKRANENGETIQQLTQRFIDFMHHDADALGVLRPDHEPRATEFVPEMLALIDKLLKQRKDSIAAFEAANRQDLADQEKAEAAVLTAYLPERMSDDEILQAVQAIVAETGASGPGDMGKVMGAAKTRLAGKADMGLVSAAVKAALSR